MPSQRDENEQEALRLFRERLETIARQHPELLTPETQARLTAYLTDVMEHEDDDEADR